MIDAADAAVVERVRTLRAGGDRAKAATVALEHLDPLAARMMPGTAERVASLVDALADVYASPPERWLAIKDVGRAELLPASSEHQLIDLFLHCATDHIGRHPFAHCIAAATIMAERGLPDDRAITLLRFIANLAVEAGRLEESLAAAVAYADVAERDEVYVPDLELVVATPLVELGRYEEALVLLEPFHEHLVEAKSHLAVIALVESLIERARAGLPKMKRR